MQRPSLLLELPSPVGLNVWQRAASLLVFIGQLPFPDFIKAFLSLWVFVMLIFMLIPRILIVIVVIKIIAVLLTV